MTSDAVFCSVVLVCTLKVSMQPFAQLCHQLLCQHSSWAGSSDQAEADGRALKPGLPALPEMVELEPWPGMQPEMKWGYLHAAVTSLPSETSQQIQKTLKLNVAALNCTLSSKATKLTFRRQDKQLCLFHMIEWQNHEGWGKTAKIKSSLWTITTSLTKP